MKKSWILLILALLLTGCRENYLAEKEFYKASQEFKKLKASFSTTQQIPAQAYDSVLKAFEHIWEKYPGTPKAADSLFVIANIKAKQKDHEEARSALQKVAQNFVSSRACDARYAIAQSYEAEGRWKDAEKAYWETAEYHPLEIKGLYSPIQVLAYYKKAKNLEARAATYQKALKHYQSVLKQIGPIQASAVVKNYMALAHLTDGKRTLAKEEWLSIAKEFPKNAYAPLSILAAAEAASTKSKISDETLALYEQFLKEYPKHSLAGKTAIRLGVSYLKRNDFENSRKWLQHALTQYFSKNQAQSADIKLLLAKSYEQEGRWPEAETVYRELAERHPDTIAALQTPFLIATHYESIGEKKKAGQILDEAIRRYETLAGQRSNTPLGQYAKYFLNSAYAKRGDWDKVLANIDEAMKKEPNVSEQGQWLLLKALISENRLHDKNKARVLYQNFLKHYSDHPLARIAKSHIEALAAN